MQRGCLAPVNEWSILAKSTEMACHRFTFPQRYDDASAKLRLLR